MSIIKLDRIVSASSEDPAFPADNLLKSRYSDKKWKCKQPGEKQISVVIQLESSVVINAIDIGNCGSAFIEILVGKSSNPDDFKVLVVASSLMTLQEAKQGENTNNVRFFKEDSLSKQVALEKWDRIKLVCSQPYNKFIQYGLSFIVIHSKSNVVENNAAPTLGNYLFKPKDVTDDISAGSLFARRKETANAELKGAAAIRAASTSGIINKKKPSKLMALYASSDQEEGDSKSSEKSSETQNSTSDNTAVLRKDSLKKPKQDQTNKTKEKPIALLNGSQAESSSSSQNGQGIRKVVGNKEKTEKIKKCIEKPFNQLMVGVVFTISGFQNPYRSDLRSKALAMGAKYRPDWDNTCTHLLCAFPNTPKFNQVLGHGKIVTKDWIENCYSRRIRLPWRRFALHPPDKTLPESEEEIYEFVPRPSSPVDNRRRLSPGPSSGEDTEEEIERVRQLQNKKHKDTAQRNESVQKPLNDPGEVSVNRSNKNESFSSLNEHLEPKNKIKELTDSVASISPKKTKIFKKNKPNLLGDESVSPEKKKKAGMGEELLTSRAKNSTNVHSTEEERGPSTNSDCKSKSIDCKPGPSRKFLDPDTIYDAETEFEPDSADSKVYDLPPLREFYDGIQFFVGQDLSSDETKKVKRYIIAHKGLLLETASRGVEFIVSRCPLEVKEMKKISPIAVGVKPDWIWMCHDYNTLVAPSKFEIN